jgi:anti-sigma regulatory factor (Ser/Thr protein kinase)
VTSPLRFHITRTTATTPERMGQRFTMRVPTDVELIEEAVDLVARHCVASGLPPRRARFNLRVALCEALANAIIYGNALDPEKSVVVEVVATDDALTVNVADEGHGFDPSALADPTEPAQLDEAGGRGLFLIRKLVDEVSFNARGNAICMVLRRA